MKGKTLVVAACSSIAVVSVLAVFGYIRSPAEEANGEKFSVETTTLGRIVDTPCTHKLLATKFGASAMVDSPLIGAARHLTMRRLSSFPFSGLNDMKLKGLQAEFSRIDPRAAECQRDKI